MATMIPTEPYEYTRESREGDIFSYFEKNLPKEYYVFHSVILDSFDKERNKFEMCEMDFLVFHPALGMLCIESKGGTTGKVFISGRVFWHLKELKPGTGKYRKGDKFRYSPFRQSKDRMHDLKDYIINQSIYLSKEPGKKLIDHCKLAFAVCFPGITSSGETITICNSNGERPVKVKFKDMLNSCETPEQKVIYGDDLKNANLLKAKVDMILSYENTRGIKTGYETGQENTRDPLTDEDVQNLFNLVLCPNYFIAETLDFRTGGKKYVQLNQEQRTVLNMMNYQQNMAVFGFAGTGKTVIALQKARLEAMNGNAVLYLCSSPLMEDTLRKMEGCNDSWEGVKNKIKIINIDRLKEEWEVDENDRDTKIEKGMERLIKDINNKKEDKKKRKKNNKNKNKNNITVIVDEGQDFGTKERERLLTGIFNFVTKGTAAVPADERSTFQTNRRGSFYIFYDQYQLFKRKSLPGIINQINCRVPLLRNCRNTESIAITAFSTIWGEDDSVLFAPCSVTGEKVKVHFCKSDTGVLLCLDEQLKLIHENNRDASETVILTAGERINDSVLVTAKGEERFVRNGGVWYYKPFKETEKMFMFTTVGDYKGLECDHVILIDFAPNELVVENSDIYRCLFYTAVTRAIKKVEIIVKNSACDMLTINNIENSKLPNKFLVRANKNFEKRDKRYQPPRLNFVDALAAEPVWEK